MAQSGAATAANIAGNGCGVLRSCFEARRSPAVAEIHFRKDRQRDVNAQFPESLGEPLWNTASALKVKRHIADTTRPCGRSGRERRHRQAVKFVAAANAVADERAKNVAELLGLLECRDVIQRLILPVSVHQHRRHCACD